MFHSGAPRRACALSAGIFTAELVSTVLTSSIFQHLVFAGRNPCRSARAGHPLSAKNLTYTLVDKLSVVPTAQVHVEAKISEFVDECASNGYLLDGIVEVSCTKTEVHAGETSDGKTLAVCFWTCSSKIYSQTWSATVPLLAHVRNSPQYGSVVLKKMFCSISESSSSFVIISKVATADLTFNWWSH